MKKILLLLICLFVSFEVKSLIKKSGVQSNVSKKECYNALDKGKKVIENNNKNFTFLLILYKGEAYHVNLFSNSEVYTFVCFKEPWE